MKNSIPSDLIYAYEKQPYKKCPYCGLILTGATYYYFRNVIVADDFEEIHRHRDVHRCHNCDCNWKSNGDIIRYGNMMMVKIKEVENKRQVKQ